MMPWPGIDTPLAEQILNGSQNGVRRLLKPGMQRTNSESRDSDMDLPASDRPSEVEPATEPQEASDASMDSGHLAPVPKVSTELQV